ncbi:MAG: hypothetical protein FJ225_11115 [Lentisphaerae bacterium]|nr:hypothetical protein [Lentisphaerota bacterium]
MCKRRPARDRLRRRGPCRAAFASALAAVALSGALLAGCQSSRDARPGDAGIEIRMVSPEVFVVDGRRVSRARVVRALKSAGAGPETPVEIAIPASLPPSQLTGLVRDLSAAGFRRVVFARPRTFTATPGDMPLSREGPGVEE